MVSISRQTAAIIYNLANLLFLLFHIPKEKNRTKENFYYYVITERRWDYEKLAVLNLEDSIRQIGENSLLCFPPVKRKSWLSLFVSMRLAIFRLMSPVQHSFEASILSHRRPINP